MTDGTWILRRVACGLTLFTAVMLGSLSAASAHCQDAWQAGHGRVKITPQHLMWMSGYGSRDKPAEGKLTDLWVKTLVLQSSSGRQAVLITLDLVGISRELSSSLADELARRHGWERSQIAFCCSHTHTGPVVGRNLESLHYRLIDDTQRKLVDEYETMLRECVLDAAAQAVNALAPCRLEWGTGKTTFAVNRRNNRPENEVPQRRETGTLVGPVDHDVPVLAVRTTEGQLRTVVFGYACHATVLSFYQWSGDYPGFAQIALEQKHPECQAMFWAGCGADQNPLPRRAVEQAQEYGQRLADAVEDVLGAPMEPLGPALTTSYQEVPLPFDKLPTREELQENAKSTDRYVAARAQIWLEQLQQDKPLPTHYPYPISVWRFGDHVEWFFLGGETVVDLALRLKAERRGTRTWVAGYSNDVMAYIPSRRVWIEGGYEGGGAMLYYGLPAIWSEMCEEIIIGNANTND
jgi:neutral ceramidase